MPLIVIEGLDGSGKHTQAELLQKSLPNAELIDFPRYNNPSSSLVREHLSGKTCPDPTLENPYAASSYYACDRVISYQTEPWGTRLNAGKTIIMDRYVTSNLIYQAAKLQQNERKEFRAWLWDYEINRLQLPPPNIVIYLQVNPDITYEMAEKRAKQGESHDENLNGQRDLYEQKLSYQRDCYFSALEVSKEYNWEIIPCVKNNKMRTIEDIHLDIINLIKTKGLL